MKHLEVKLNFVLHKCLRNNEWYLKWQPISPNQTPNVGKLYLHQQEYHQRNQFCLGRYHLHWLHDLGGDFQELKDKKKNFSLSILRSIWWVILVPILDSLNQK